MAHLRAEKLEQALQSHLRNIYLVTGDDPLLMQESCDAIRQAAYQAGFVERDIFQANHLFDWSQLNSSANSLSLFAEKKLLEVRLDSKKISNAGVKAIETLCAEVSEDNLLLIIMPKIDKRQQKSPWFSAIERTGDIVQVWPIPAPQLPRWIDQRLKKAGLQADSHAIDILVSRIEGNLLAAVQEIEKLKLLAPEGLVNAKLMASAVMDSARYDVFSLVDKALHGDGRAAAKSLHGLHAEGTEAPAVLWALAREIRLLYNLAYAMQAGDRFDYIASRNGVWDNRKPLIKQALKRLNMTDLQELLRQSNHVDQLIKGIKTGDVWSNLLNITLRLSGTQVLANPTYS